MQLILNYRDNIMDTLLFSLVFLRKGSKGILGWGNVAIDPQFQVPEFCLALYFVGVVNSIE